jgi:hypothetical protein
MFSLQQNWRGQNRFCPEARSGSGVSPNNAYTCKYILLRSPPPKKPKKQKVKSCLLIKNLKSDTGPNEHSQTTKKWIEI